MLLPIAALCSFSFAGSSLGGPGAVCWDGLLGSKCTGSAEYRDSFMLFLASLEEDPELEACSRLRLFESLTATKESSRTSRIEINIHNLYLESK